MMTNEPHTPALASLVGVFLTRGVVAMTDQITALRALEKAVEDEAVDGMTPHCDLPAIHVLGAYCGSLDAAKAMHDAMLPGWDLLITTYEDGLFEVSVSEPLVVKTYDGLSEIISRAWLLAIIRAVMAKGGV